MQKLEGAIKVLRYISENFQPSYSRADIAQMLDTIGLTYQAIEADGEFHYQLDLYPEVVFHFTYENNHYEITKFNIVHDVLNDITEFYNNLQIDREITESELEICYTDMKLLKTVGVDRWGDKEIAVKKTLKIFNDDPIVAACMVLKYAGGEKNQRISYIERHSTPRTYRGFNTEMYIELYNRNYELMGTLDIMNMHLIEDNFEILYNLLENWDNERNADK